MNPTAPRLDSFVSLLAVAMLAVGLGACTVEDPATPETDDLSSTSVVMPKAIVQYEAKMGWNTHHLRWHTERQWNLLSPSDLSWAKKQGWTAATIQEGQAGNGLEFLAMHRIMIQTLVHQFPTDAPLFGGWQVIPTKPGDPTAPKTTEAFSPDMLKAIDKLQNHIGDFKSDDDFGLYLETNLRPTSKNADNQSTDATTGIHNYIHNRFADSSSKVDLGDPSLNLQNKIFWRLHGWIDARWTAFRAAKGLTDKDPAYLAALKHAEDTMMQDMPKLGAPEGGEQSDPPPATLTKMFEQE